MQIGVDQQASGIAGQVRCEPDRQRDPLAGNGVVKRTLACRDRRGELAGLGPHRREGPGRLDGKGPDKGSRGGGGLGKRDAGQRSQGIQALQEQGPARHVSGGQFTIPRPRHSVSASASPLVWSTGQASLSASGRLPWRTGKTTALHPCQNRSPVVIRFHWRARSCSRQGTAAIHALPSGESTAARSGAVRSVRACIGTEPPFSLTGARIGPARATRIVRRADALDLLRPAPPGRRDLDHDRVPPQ